MVSNMDYHFGRVVDFLKDIGEYENTVIIFLSDNGPNPWYSENYPGARDPEWVGQFDNRIENIGRPGSHFAYGIGWSAASSGPFSLAKMTVGEGGIRSPLIISGPGIKGGRRTDAVAYVTGIMPTILELARLDHPDTFRGRKVEPMRGRSMVGVLSGAKSEVYGEDDVFGGEMLNGRWMRRGDFKALFVPPPFGRNHWELYNVAADPGETHDLAKEKPEMLEELIKAWDEWAEEVGVVLTDQ
jgi:arylsulfatase